MIVLGLELLPKVTVGVTQFVGWLNTLRAAANQTGEWTEEMQQAWRAGLLAQGLTPEEIPDAV
jgi:hypothetical protein